MYLQKLPTDLDDDDDVFLKMYAPVTFHSLLFSSAKQPIKVRNILPHIIEIIVTIPSFSLIFFLLAEGLHRRFVARWWMPDLAPSLVVTTLASISRKYAF